MTAFDMDLARRAHAHTSFTPERRAEQERAAFVSHLAAVDADLTPLAETDEQRAILADELARYEAGYRSRFYAVLAAKSRTASSMITGPANFPTRRNQKALDAEMSRETDLHAWSQRAYEAMRRRILAARTPEQASADAFAKVKRWIDKDMATVAEIDAGQSFYNRSAFTTSVTEKLRRMHANGETAAVRAALAYIREKQAAQPKPFLAARNTIWQLADAPDPEPEQAKTGQEVISESPEVRAVRNLDADRLQLIFADKPNEVVRAKLKGSGWRWSPSAGAWQRQITPNAEYDLARFLEALPDLNASAASMATYWQHSASGKGPRADITR